LSWYYVFAFVVIIVLAVFLYQSFRNIEGLQTDAHLKVGDVAWYKMKPTGSPTILKVLNDKQLEFTNGIYNKNEFDYIQDVNIGDNVSMMDANYNTKNGKIIDIKPDPDNSGYSGKIFTIEYCDKSGTKEDKGDKIMLIPDGFAACPENTTSTNNNTSTNNTTSTENDTNPDL
jgi:hypothetical protein